jgi:hypothetical protein
MTESSGGGAPVAAPEESAWGRIWGVLTAPAETFPRLAARPTFAVALTLLLALGTTVGWIAMSKVTPEEFLRTFEERGQPVPPSLEDDPEGFLAKIQWFQTASGTVVAALFYLAAGGIFLALFRLFGSDLTYRQSLATTVHGLLPLGIAAIAGIVVLLGRQEVGLEELQTGGIVASNLAALAGEETGKAARALLASIDLFSAWSLYLLATGYRVVARVSSGAAWSVVLSLWGVGVGIKVALAAAF